MSPKIYDVYPPVLDFCDYCGCSARVFLLKEDGSFVCARCLEILESKEENNEE